MPSIGITVLMAVYSGESPDNLDMSLRSLLEQTFKDFNVLLVIDGPVSESIHAIIDKYLSLLNIRTLVLKENQGLALALNAGLATVDSDWIVRFDTDDICLPERISKQINYIKSSGCDFFGAQIVEFDDSNERIIRYRMVPTCRKEIQRRILYRNPFNHMTMCYKTEIVKKAGGYPNIPFMEDYALWIKLVSLGYSCCNSPEVLVRVRVGSSMLRRRSGIDYCKSEIKIRKLLAELDFASRLKIYLIGVLRLVAIMAPATFRAFIYRHALRAKKRNGFHK